MDTQTAGLVTSSDGNAYLALPWSVLVCEPSQRAPNNPIGEVTENATGGSPEARPATRRSAGA